MTTTDDIQQDLRRAFSAYTTSNRRALMVLAGKLAVLDQRAAASRLPATQFAAMVRDELERADRRMKEQTEPQSAILTEAFQ